MLSMNLCCTLIRTCDFVPLLHTRPRVDSARQCWKDDQLDCSYSPHRLASEIRFAIIVLVV